MPTNVSPEYKAAESAYRATRDPEARLRLLHEMLRTVPKHKGTEHLQADIKTRIKELTDAARKSPHTGARSGPDLIVATEGAAQVALLGPPNSGKSSLHHALTGSNVAVGEFPFTTQYPAPGMVEHREAQVQLVDLPPISAAHELPWIGNALQSADGALLVVDVARPGCVEDVVVLHELLEARKVHLVPDWEEPLSVDDDPFATVLPTVLVAAKCDLASDVEEQVAVLEELAGLAYPVLHASAVTGEGLEELVAWLFEQLGIIRVHTKVPGLPADEGKPYALRRGATIHDVAEMIHRDIAANLRYARLWRPGGADGQQVGRDYVVEDGDIVELHT
ncbi:MAG TPA: GTPase [Acidimicrobiia bacterium]|jgi:ribosome-interacting GTPase 1